MDQPLEIMVQFVIYQKEATTENSGENEPENQKA